MIKSLLAMIKSLLAMIKNLLAMDGDVSSKQVPMLPSMHTLRSRSFRVVMLLEFANQG